MKCRTSFAGLLMLAVIVISACSDKPLDPPPPGMGPGGGPERGMRIMRKHPPAPLLFGDVSKLKRKLGLTQLQIDRISAINAKYAAIHRQLWDEAAPLRRQLKEEILSEKMDREKVRALLEELSRNDVERQLAVIDQRIEIERELNEQQRNTIIRKFHHRL